MTAAHIDSAIATTAQNPAAITPHTGTFSDPPTQTEMLASAACLEIVGAAKDDDLFEEAMKLGAEWRARANEEGR